MMTENQTPPESAEDSLIKQCMIFAADQAATMYSSGQEVAISFGKSSARAFLMATKHFSDEKIEEILENITISFPK